VPSDDLKYLLLVNMWKVITVESLRWKHYDPLKCWCSTTSVRGVNSGDCNMEIDVYIEFVIITLFL